MVRDHVYQTPVLNPNPQERIQNHSEPVVNQFNTRAYSTSGRKPVAPTTEDGGCHEVTI